MLRIILLAALSVTAEGPAHDAGETPQAVHAAMVADLAALPPGRAATARYLSMAAWLAEERPRRLAALAFALNSTSSRGTMAPPEVVGPALLRVDLAAYGWDKGSRAARLAEMERRGVRYAFKDAAQRALFLDPWEQFARDDPYFRAPYGQVRGWIDPRFDETARTLSYSGKPIVRADWLLGRLLLEKGFGGYYSTLLMLPPNEGDLYKVFGVDLGIVDRDNQLKRGGAVLESVVALHNRELQEIPSIYGFDERFIWRTFDVNKDDVGDKSVLEVFAGTLKHDGREIIGTLPNGLHWYYLSNGAGVQAEEVPPDIAQDKRDVPGIRERRVVNAYKCVACHGPVNGIYPFDDVVGKAMLRPDVALAVASKGKDYEKAAALQAQLEDYYLSDLGRRIDRQQDSYSARIEACNGLTSAESSKLVVGLIEAYTHDLVSPVQAAREAGLREDAAMDLWRRSGQPQLVVLSSGQAIRRAAWEKSFADAMLAVRYPWEKSGY